MTVPPRMVAANTFKAWWMRLMELGEDDDSHLGPRHLLDHLYQFAQRAGAAGPPWERVGERTSETPFATWRRRPTLNPNFDWLRSQIDFAPPGQYVSMDPDVLIAAIERVTGIKEHGS
jgi:hypothetical protein